MQFGMQKKHKRFSYIIAILCAIIGLFAYTSEVVMFSVVRLNDTGYYQQRITTLTEVNKQMESLMETVKIELSDNPELQNYVEQYLKEEISSNNEEISSDSTLQERADFYRWLLYFK